MSHEYFPINLTMRNFGPDVMRTYVYTKFYEDMESSTILVYIHSITQEVKIKNPYIKITAKCISKKRKGLIACTYDPEQWGSKQGIKELMNFQDFFILPVYKVFYMKKRPWKTFSIEQLINNEKVSYRWMAVVSKKLTQEQLSVLLVDSDATIRLLAQGRLKHKLYKRSR